MPDSLWGDLEEDLSIRTPVALLKEQGDYLTRLTKSILRGEVTNVTGPKHDFSYNLDIRAPYLNDYRVTIVNIAHGLDLYPLELEAVGGLSVICEDEKEFVTALEKALSAGKVRKIIGTLVAQSKA